MLQQRSDTTEFSSISLKTRNEMGQETWGIQDELREASNLAQLLTEYGKILREPSRVSYAFCETLLQKIDRVTNLKKGVQIMRPLRLDLLRTEDEGYNKCHKTDVDSYFCSYLPRLFETFFLGELID